MNATITPSGAEGERLMRGAHAVLSAHRELYILRGRRALLAALLDKGEASADDVRDAVEVPKCIDPVCLGAVPGELARAGIIARAGFATTARPVAHARPVSVWRLRDRTAALEWMRTHPDRPDPADAGHGLKTRATTVKAEHGLETRATTAADAGATLFEKPINETTGVDAPAAH